jgi:hypothetical protein
VWLGSTFKFAWADLVTENVTAAQKFYAEQFGWTIRLGGYVFAAKYWPKVQYTSPVATTSFWRMSPSNCVAIVKTYCVGIIRSLSR